ncbi:hypothetical protein ACFQZJ_00300 [Maribacter chungangensis]|uniref:Uncharacterized protein n=1 Tax=Maribacter chungangensis TaxID=1069117 RepID=A0ABW3AYF3_9FLAO
MTLTQDHIQDLYKFTRAHYVEHYDLQTELVDHLANGIEQQWEEHPSLGFEEAKQREFKKFGKAGFKKVIAARKKAMIRKYRGILWGYFMKWWTFPKIITTFSGVLIVFCLLRTLPEGDSKFISVAAVLLGLSILMYQRIFQLKSNLEGLCKKWLLQEMIYEKGVTIQFLLFPIYFVIIGNKAGFLENTFGQLVFTALLIVVLILFIISAYVIPSKAEELLAETYPEYKFQEKV